MRMGVDSKTTSIMMGECFPFVNLFKTRTRLTQENRLRVPLIPGSTGTSTRALTSSCSGTEPNVQVLGSQLQLLADHAG